MDDEAAAEITRHMAPGETLLWAGRPFPATYAFYNGGGMGCFGLFCIGGLALQWGSWRLFLIALPILLLPGLAAYRAKSVRYGLTDRRAIIAAGWPWPSLQSIPVDRFNICMRQDWGKPHSSVMFRKTPDPMNIWRGTPFKADAFVGIKDVEEVEKLILRFYHGRETHA